MEFNRQPKFLCHINKPLIKRTEPVPEGFSIQSFADKKPSSVLLNENGFLLSSLPLVSIALI